MIRIISVVFVLLALAPAAVLAAGSSKRSLESGESITFVYGK